MQRKWKYLVGFHIVIICIINLMCAPTILENHYFNKILERCRENCVGFPEGYSYSIDKNAKISNLSCDCMIVQVESVSEEKHICPKECQSCMFRQHIRIIDISSESFDMSNDNSFVDLILKHDRMIKIARKYPTLSIINFYSIILLTGGYAIFILLTAFMIKS